MRQDDFDPTDVLTAEGVAACALDAYHLMVLAHRGPPEGTPEHADHLRCGGSWSTPEDFAMHLVAEIASGLVVQVMHRTGRPFGFSVGGFDVPMCDV
jgi:hypothetical protein